MEVHMVRKVILAAALTLTLGLVPQVASAASNPSGTGQPGAECGASGATSEPAGFSSGGFANAETHYAGSDGTSSLNSGNDHAVSQYDVACYQVTQSGH
jgi:hypothetical protein